MLPLVLFAVFLLVPVLEIYLIVQVAELIGGWQTFGLLVLGVVLGTWIVRREGRRAWRALNGAVRTGVMPERSLADAGLVLAGGLLLIIPGFVTDLIGLIFVLPFTRPLVRALSSRWIGRRLAMTAASIDLPPLPGFGGPETTEPPHGDVVRGEVIREDQDQ
jgi:UPF0716 family protein affecting phage T7 exclusion